MFDLPQGDFLVELDVVNASHSNFDTNGGIYLRSNFSAAWLYPRGVVLAWGDTFPFGGGDVYWHTNQGSGYTSAQNAVQNVFASGQTLHLRIEVRGNTFTAWVNDSLSPTTTLVTPNFPAGKIALLDAAANGTSFDNIFIQSLTSCDPASGNEPVRIIQRPQSQTVPAGTLVSLSVAATGTGPLAYQWLLEGNCVSGANAGTFDFTATTGTAGRWECTVTNACGAVGSYPATVMVQASALRADLSCDGTLNGDDIDAFVQALLNPVAWQAAHPGCNILNGDINGDGQFNESDRDPFVNCILNGCP